MRITWPLRTAPQAAKGAASAAHPPAAPPVRIEEAEFAVALGVTPAELEAMPLELDGEEAAAAALVRFHYFAHRPEPAAFPRVALGLLDLLLDAEVDVGELCRQVELDAALTGAVLARANTAAGRAIDPIQTVAHAVTRLGLSEVSRVAAATAMRTLYDGRIHEGFSAFVPVWPILFGHAMVSGRLAAELARGRAGVSPEVAFVAGLLHDVGMPVAMRSLASLTLDGTLPLREPASVLRILAQVHVELGVEAARGWRLPPLLVEAVARHHEEGLPAQGDLLTLHLVRLASALDLRLSAPAAAPTAVREAVQATRALGGTPAWLAAAAARREDAVAWARRCLALP